MILILIVRNCISINIYFVDQLNNKTHVNLHLTSKIIHDLSTKMPIHFSTYCNIQIHFGH